jgi:competence protein ComEC
MLLAAFGGVWFRRHNQPSPAPQAVVAFLDVGDGDCALVRTADGTTILVDAGGAETAPHVVSVLRHLGVHTIDLLVLASSRSGSIGGVPAVLSSLSVRGVWDNAQDSHNEARQRALEAVRRSHVGSRIVHSGDKLQIGAATFFTVLWPPERSPRARQDALICQLDYGTTRFLFVGAAAAETPSYWIAEADDTLGCGMECSDLVLQVSADGAEAGTSAELLHRIGPTAAVISCSPQHPPSALVTHRVQSAGAAIWQTSTMGTVIVKTDGRTNPSITAEHL